MKGKSYIQAELNLVLHVAAPVSFFDFIGLGERSAISPQTQSHNCHIKHSNQNHLLATSNRLLAMIEFPATMTVQCACVQLKPPG